MMRHLVGILFALLLGSFARADNVNQEWYSTARALGMGNVGIASAEDPVTSLYYNPALLAKTRKAGFEFFNPHIETGLGNFTVASGISDYSSLATLEKTVPLLQKHHNKSVSFKAAMAPTFFTQNFALGVMGSDEFGSYIDNDVLLHYRQRFVLGASMGMSFSLFNGLMRFGSAVRAVQLTSNDRTTTSTVGIAYNQSAQEGFGINYDGGWTWSLPMYGVPTFGAVVRNIGGAKFNNKAPVKLTTGAAGGNPSPLRTTIDAGFSFAPKPSQRSVFTLAADYRDIRNTSHTRALRKINLGGELAFNKVFFLRAGMSRGYYTAGMGIEGKKSSVEFTTYAEEWDSTKYHVLEDRRVVLRVGSKF